MPERKAACYLQQFSSLFFLRYRFTMEPLLIYNSCRSDLSPTSASLLCVLGFTIAHSSVEPYFRAFILLKYFTVQKNQYLRKKYVNQMFRGITLFVCGGVTSENLRGKKSSLVLLRRPCFYFPMAKMARRDRKQYAFQLRYLLTHCKNQKNEACP